MNKEIVSTVGGKSRADYSRLLEAVPALKGGDFLVQRSQLRMETPLINNKPNYRFELFPTTVNARVSEKRLNRNDLFCITSIALGITKWDATADTYGNWPLYFYPDGNFFLGVASSVRESDCLNAVYNAVMSLKSGSTERIPPFLTADMRYSPERGFTYGVAASHILYNDHAQLPKVPWQDTEPLVILSGQDDNVMSLDLPKSDLSVLQGGVNQSGSAVATRNVAVLLLDGFVIAEGAQVATRFNTF